MKYCSDSYGNNFSYGDDYFLGITEEGEALLKKDSRIHDEILGIVEEDEIKLIFVYFNKGSIIKYSYLEVFNYGEYKKHFLRNQRKLKLERVNGK